MSRVGGDIDFSFKPPLLPKPIPAPPALFERLPNPELLLLLLIEVVYLLNSWEGGNLEVYWSSDKNKP